MFIGLRVHEKQARVHFIPNLKVGIFVTLRAPKVRNSPLTLPPTYLFWSPFAGPLPPIAPIPRPVETYLDHFATWGGDTMIGVLGLEDGTKVEGVGFGAPGIVSGELVFVTVMSGYEEALTDPSYKEQLLMFTYPLMGNYGVSGDLFQSDRIHTTAMVCKEVWDRPHHHRATRTLDQFLNDEGIPGIHGLDTRMLTIKIRTKGAMNAALAVGEASEVNSLDIVEMAREQPDISSLNLVNSVTCKEPSLVIG